MVIIPTTQTRPKVREVEQPTQGNDRAWTQTQVSDLGPAPLWSATLPQRIHAETPVSWIG